MKTILIVDDDPNILELVRINCEEQGYLILTAVSEMEIIRIVEKYSPKLIILDVMTSKLNGWDLCKKIRAEYNKSIKLIMLLEDESEWKESNDVSNRLADECVIKPFDIGKLLLTIKGFLSD